MKILTHKHLTHEYIVLYMKISRFTVYGLVLVSRAPKSMIANKLGTLTSLNVSYSLHNYFMGASENYLAKHKQ